MKVHGYGSSGAALCCGLIHQHRCEHPLPIIVTYALVVAGPCRGLVQDEWQGATRLRVRLCGQSAARCVQGGAWMRVKCTRLSIPAATRMCTRCANYQTMAVSRLQRKSWHCGDARLMDVLLGLMQHWRWSGEPYIPVCPSVGRNLGELSAGDLPQADFWPSSMRVELVSIGPVHAKAIFHQLIKKDRQLPDRRPLTK
jgi:hypothetical protein